MIWGGRPELSFAAARARAPYQLLYETLGRLAETQPGWATLIDYGITPGGRGLRLIKIQRPDWNQAGRERPAALITGAIHGDEYLEIEHRLIAWFLKNKHDRPNLRQYLQAGGIIYVVPITNPDGYERNRRTNNNGADLNRDFDLPLEQQVGFRETETRSLANWLDQELSSSNARLKLSVDYHCCNGSLLYPWSFRHNSLPPVLEAAHARIGELMQEDIDPSYSVGPTGKVLGYLARGTAKDYFHAKYGTLAFTFEAKTRQIEAARFARHALWWEHLLQLLLE